MSVFDRAYIEERIEAIKAQVVEADTAISAAMTSLTYSLDTGQTRQSVTRQQISSLRTTRDSLIAELAYWQGQLSGTGATRVIPGF